MSVRITHKRLSNGTEHQHITELQWTNEATSATGSSTRAAMVDFVDKNPAGSAYTREGATRANVGSVHPAQGQPYVRTYSDGKWTNNLLALPDF